MNPTAAATRSSRSTIALLRCPCMLAARKQHFYAPRPYFSAMDVDDARGGLPLGVHVVHPGDTITSDPGFMRLGLIVALSIYSASRSTA